MDSLYKVSLHDLGLFFLDHRSKKMHRKKNNSLCKGLNSVFASLQYVNNSRLKNWWMYVDPKLRIGDTFRTKHIVLKGGFEDYLEKLLFFLDKDSRARQSSQGLWEN